MTFDVCRASAGTGKTYTLAAHYIALLLGSDYEFAYRGILAVTFTNKATEEMKQRILSYLYIIAEGDADDPDRAAFIKKTAGYVATQSPFAAMFAADNEELRDKAGRIYHNILADYDNMKIMTIDSFLQTLISGMAHYLGIGAAFSVLLNAKQVVSTAVDELMTTRLTPEAKTLLIAYVKELLDNEKSWNVRKNIIDMSLDVQKESVQSEGEDVVFDSGRVERYKKSLRETFYSYENQVKQAVRPYYAVVRDCEANAEIKGGSRYYSMISRIRQSLDGNVDEKDYFRGLGEADLGRLGSDAFLKKFASPERGREVSEALAAMQEICTKLRDRRLQFVITNQYLNDLSLMAEVKKRIDGNLNESNSILLARTAYVLSRALKPGDADFILEKAGIRFHHIMIDEFQDTSTLQWEVFRKLVVEVLSSGGTTLVVGDVKQGIYRWRNGNSSIMADMSPLTPEIGAYYNKESEQLSRNFRSQANVVRFNLSLFDRLTQPGGIGEPFADTYREGKRGYAHERLGEFHNKKRDEGYVCFSPYLCVPKRVSAKENLSDEQRAMTRERVNRDFVIRDMFSDIGRLLDLGASPSDIMILVRYHGEANEIVDAFGRSDLAGRGVTVCSSDSFWLENSLSVQIVVAVLKVFDRQDKIARRFLQNNGVDVERLSSFDRRMPLYELVELVIREFLCDADGKVVRPDMEYIDCLLDNLRKYIDSYGSDLKAFLTYWEDELHSTSVAMADGGGIRVLTVHSAKGLEASHLFIPFCSWVLSKDQERLWVPARGRVGVDCAADALPLIPVKQSSRMQECKEYREFYDREKRAQLVDNLNLLYVALTRAADNLYVYTTVLLQHVNGTKDECLTVGDVLFSALADERVEGGVTLREELLDAWEGCGESTPAVAHYTLGITPYIQAGRNGGRNTPFSYSADADSRIIADSFFTNDAVSFRQSQESELYTPFAADGAPTKLDRINAGNLRHSILSEVTCSADLDRVVDKYLAKGLIETHTEALAIKGEIERAWAPGSKMGEWFDGTWEVWREATILCPPRLSDRLGVNGELRPDRVMIKGNRAIVLDYKFGKPDDAKYHRQVRGYIEVLRLMGYTDVRGYLWYGFENRLEEVK